MSKCTCPEVKVGGKPTGQRNLSPNCPVKEHRDKEAAAARRLGFH